MYKSANAKLASPSLAPDKWTSIAGGIVPNSSECVVATTFSSHIKYNWLSQVPILFSKSLHKICLVSNKIHFYLSNWWWVLYICISVPRLKSQCGARDFWLWCQSDPEWPPQDSNSRLRSFWLPSWYHLGYMGTSL